MTELLNQLSQEFDDLCQQRHETGQAKYGEFTYIEADMFKNMAEEIADLANYARYQYIKLRMLEIHFNSSVEAVTGDLPGIAGLHTMSKDDDK